MRFSSFIIYATIGLLFVGCSSEPVDSSRHVEKDLTSKFKLVESENFSVQVPNTLSITDGLDPRSTLEFMSKFDEHYFILFDSKSDTELLSEKMERIRGAVTQLHEFSSEGEAREGIMKISGQELGRKDRTIFTIGSVQVDNTKYIILEKYPEQDSLLYDGYLSFSLNSIK